MIYQLDKQDYYDVNKLLNTDQKNSLTINRGSIYVDHPDKPTTALVDETGIISFFIGDATNQTFHDDLLWLEAFSK